jgi:hypothetical protein
MIPIGFLARAIDSRSGESTRDPRLLFLPMLLVVTMVKQETGYVAFVASLAGTVLLAAVAARLVTGLSRISSGRRQPQRSRSSSSRSRR